MRAMLWVDPLGDFMPWGSLPVKDGHLIVPVLNAAADDVDVVILVQEWHPENHGSFADSHDAEPYTVGELGGRPQMMWPKHCVQGTPGAEPHPDLRMSKVSVIFRKGMNPLVDSYSAFFDNAGLSTGLADLLRALGVTEVWVCGLATDYCVKATAIHAANCGFTTILLLDGCRGVAPDTTETAIKEMRQAGVMVTTLAQIRMAPTAAA